MASESFVLGMTIWNAVQPIGWVRSSRDEAIDDNWDVVESIIEIDCAQFPRESLDGIDAFSHVEVIFMFDRVSDDQITVGARHPRGNTRWPQVGIFAQRGKNRPNRLGLTSCRLVSREGLNLRVVGLDAIDGTPVLDIKPVMREFEPRGEILQPDWATELMASYW